MVEQWWKDMVEVPKWAEGLMIYIGVLQDRVTRLENDLAFISNLHGTLLTRLDNNLGSLSYKQLCEKEAVHDLNERLALLRGTHTRLR